MKKCKKFLSVGLTVVMMLSVLSIGMFGVFAADVASGNCGADGDNVTWVLDDSGTLTISGTGAMKDYYPEDYYSERTRWYNNSNIKSVVIVGGVTSIGEYAFFGCENLKSIIIPDSVVSIGESAFSDCKNLNNIIIPDSVVSIGEGAFSNCKNLNNIIIPASVRSIGYEAFWNVNTDFTIYCYKNSYAHHYAIEKQEKFEIIPYGSYVVIFVDKYGNIIGNVQKVKSGESATEPVPPEYEGYAFDYWEIIGFRNVKDHLIVKAMYVPSTTYYVTFKAGSNKIATAKEYAKKVIPSGKNPSNVITANELKSAKFGGFFFRLFFKPTGNWTDVNGNVITNITSNITLYAQYKFLGIF